MWTSRRNREPQRTKVWLLFIYVMHGKSARAENKRNDELISRRMKFHRNALATATNSILRICFSSYILFILNAVNVCFYYVFLSNIPTIIFCSLVCTYLRRRMYCGFGAQLILIDACISVCIMCTTCAYDSIWLRWIPSKCREKKPHPMRSC